MTMASGNDSIFSEQKDPLTTFLFHREVPRILELCWVDCVLATPQTLKLLPGPLRGSQGVRPAGLERLVFGPPIQAE